MRPVLSQTGGAEDPRVSALATLAEVMGTLAARGGNLVAEVLALAEAADGFAVWDHLPSGDVADPHSTSQWYYHAHPPSEVGDGPHDAEHGHFHLFMREEGAEGLTHICGVAMSTLGTPISLFATNGWVTGEAWLPADRTAALARRWDLSGAARGGVVNEWLTALVTLYEDEITAMLSERDVALSAFGSDRPLEDVLEDRDFEVAAHVPVDLTAKADALGF